MLTSQPYWVADPYLSQWKGSSLCTMFSAANPESWGLYGVSLTPWCRYTYLGLMSPTVVSHSILRQTTLFPELSLGTSEAMHRLSRIRRAGS